MNTNVETKIDAKAEANLTESGKKPAFSITDLTEISLFAALIFLCIQYIRIPAGEQFVHFGNALVVVGVLVFGFKKGTIAGCLGLFLFDAINGYMATSWIYTLEALIVCITLYLFFEKLMKKNDKISNIVALGIIAAIVKIVVNALRYTFFNGMFVEGLPLKGAIISAAVKISGTFGSAIFTIITVPLLYPIFKKITSIPKK